MDNHTHGHIHTYGQLNIPNSPKKKPEYPEGGENMQTTHTGIGLELKPGTLVPVSQQF